MAVLRWEIFELKFESARKAEIDRVSNTVQRSGIDCWVALQIENFTQSR